MDDFLIERLALMLVVLADVDAHQHALTLESMHGQSPKSAALTVQLESRLVNPAPI
jgi:hypothetical protein